MQAALSSLPLHTTFTRTRLTRITRTRLTRLTHTTRTRLTRLTRTTLTLTRYAISWEAKDKLNAEVNKGALRVRRWLMARGVRHALPEQCGYVPLVESDEAAELGGKKLITYSLYGANPKYVNGAVKNAQMLGKVFPGWQARFYTDLGTVPAHIQSALLAAGAEIYPIDMAKYGSQSMFWRFWAAADPTVERFISRDVDSLLMARDAVAVAAWEQSGKAFHVVRDHPSHSRYPMSGGLWGARRGALPQVLELIASFPSDSKYLTDMNFLNSLVWPIAMHDVLQHDAFSCRDFDGASPFPVAHDAAGHHVGQVFDAKGTARQGDVDMLRLALVDQPVQCKPGARGSSQSGPPADPTVECLATQRQHSVVVGVSWGSLSAAGQLRWRRLDCDRSMPTQHSNRSIPTQHRHCSIEHHARASVSSLNIAEPRRYDEHVVPLRKRDARDICGGTPWRRRGTTAEHPTDVAALVTCVCVTLGIPRSAHLHRLLKSIASFYPGLRSVVVSAGLAPPVPDDVCDKARSVWHLADVTMLVANPPTGNVSLLRNIGVARVRTRFLLSIDDDFLFTEHTRIDNLLSLTLRNDVDVVAGLVSDGRCNKKSRHISCRDWPPTSVVMTVPTRDGWAQCSCGKATHCDLSQMMSPEHVGCVRVSYVRQFFLARTTAMLAAGWDEANGWPDHWHGMWRLRLSNARMLGISLARSEPLLLSPLPPHLCSARTDKLGSECYLATCQRFPLTYVCGCAACNASVAEVLHDVASVRNYDSMAKESKPRENGTEVHSAWRQKDADTHEIAFVGMSQTIQRNRLVHSLVRSPPILARLC